MIDSATGTAPGSRRQAVDKLLALLACGELSAFERTATDSRFAPNIADKVELARHAVTEWQHYELVAGRLAEHGVDVNAVMSTYEAPLEIFHDRTRPRDWFESLMKAYVSDGIVNDFYRAFAANLDPSTRELIEQVLARTEHTDFIVDRLRGAIARDDRLGGRLALWGRRLVGEALSQAGHVAEREGTGLIGLLDGPESSPESSPESGPAEAGEPAARIGRIFAAMTEEHSRRMMALGLNA